MRGQRGTGGPVKLLSGLDLGDTAVAGNRHRANGVRPGAVFVTACLIAGLRGFQGFPFSLFFRFLRGVVNQFEKRLLNRRLLLRIGEYF